MERALCKLKHCDEICNTAHIDDNAYKSDIARKVKRIFRRIYTTFIVFQIYRHVIFFPRIVEWEFVNKYQNTTFASGFFSLSDSLLRIKCDYNFECPFNKIKCMQIILRFA